MAMRTFRSAGVSEFRNCGDMENTPIWFVVYGGILAYLQERYDEASHDLDAAGPARPTEGMRANFDLQKMGLFILGECCKRKEPSWYADAIKAAKTDGQKLALKLADTYLHSQRADKAEAIFNQVLAGDPPLGRPSKAAEGYCLMQLALVYSIQNVNRDKSIEFYRRFFRKEYADLPWAATAIMRLAVLEYNSTQDPHRAIRYYQYVLTKYPNHPDAERAVFPHGARCRPGARQNACRGELQGIPQEIRSQRLEQFRVEKPDSDGVEQRRSKITR